MLVGHAHQPGRFDPGHCRACARETDLLDHYGKVQREEQAFKEAHRWARRAHRQASWALWSSGTGILLAVVALLTG
jgi:ferric-dicitrate binding protein FerR (iron transport regulator)